MNSKHQTILCGKTNQKGEFLNEKPEKRKFLEKYNRIGLEMQLITGSLMNANDTCLLEFNMRLNRTVWGY